MTGTAVAGLCGTMAVMATRFYRKHFLKCCILLGTINTLLLLHHPLPSQLPLLYSPSFEDPLTLASPPDYITIAGILLQIIDFDNPNQELESLLEFSSGHPLHLIVITDRASIYRVGKMIGDCLSREISYRVIKNKWNRSRRIPRLKVR